MDSISCFKVVEMTRALSTTSLRCAYDASSLKGSCSIVFQVADAVSQAASIVASKSRSTICADPGKSDVRDLARGCSRLLTVGGMGVARGALGAGVALTEFSREWDDPRLLDDTCCDGPLLDDDARDWEEPLALEPRGFLSTDFRAAELLFTAVTVLDDDAALESELSLPIIGDDEAAKERPICTSLKLNDPPFLRFPRVSGLFEADAFGGNRADLGGEDGDSAMGVILDRLAIAEPERAIGGGRYSCSNG